MDTLLAVSDVNSLNFVGYRLRLPIVYLQSRLLDGSTPKSEPDETFQPHDSRLKDPSLKSKSITTSSLFWSGASHEAGKHEPRTLQLHRVLNALLDDVKGHRVPYFQPRIKYPASVSDLVVSEERQAEIKTIYDAWTPPVFGSQRDDDRTQSYFTKKDGKKVRIKTRELNFKALSSTPPAGTFVKVTDCPRCLTRKGCVKDILGCSGTLSIFRDGTSVRHICKCPRCEYYMVFKPSVAAPLTKSEKLRADYEATKKKQGSDWEKKLRGLGMPMKFDDRFAVKGKKVRRFESITNYNSYGERIEDHLLVDEETPLPDHRGETRTPEEFRRKAAEFITLAREEIKTLAVSRNKAQLVEHKTVKEYASIFNLMMLDETIEKEAVRTDITEEALKKTVARYDQPRQVSVENIPYEEMRQYWHAVVLFNNQGPQFYRLVPVGATPQEIIDALDAQAHKTAMQAYDRRKTKGGYGIELFDVMQNVWDKFLIAALIDPVDVASRSIEQVQQNLLDALTSRRSSTRLSNFIPLL